MREELPFPILDVSEERGVRVGVDEILDGARVLDQSNALRVPCVGQNFDVLLSRRIVKIEVSANDVRRRRA